MNRHGSSNSCQVLTLGISNPLAGRLDKGKDSYPLGFQMRVRALAGMFLALLMAHSLFPNSIVCSLHAEQAQSSTGERDAVSRATNAMHAGDTQAAISILVAWVQSHPSSFQARVTLGGVYQAARQPERAETEFTAALQLHPNDPAALLALGSLYNQQRQFEKAEPLLRQAAASGQNPAAHFQLAMTLAELHRYAQAAVALRQVHPPQAADQRIAYQRLKASIDMGNGHAQYAAADMEEALQISPHDAGLQVSTGIAEVQSKNWKRAISLLQPAFENHPNLLVGMSLLQAQVASREDIEATLGKLRAVSMPAEDALPFHLELGKVLANGGLDKEAASEFQTAADLAPNRADILFDLALEQYRSRELDAALATEGQAKALGDTAELEDLQGDIQEERGDYVAAVQSYQRAVALAPKDERYRLSLGFDLLRHQSFEPALAVFQQAAEYFPESVPVHVAMGMTYFFLQRYHEASQVLIQAASLDRKSDLAFNYLCITQLDQPVVGDGAAITTICQRADSNPQYRPAATYCGALLLRKAIEAGDKSQTQEILRRLNVAVSLASNDPIANCQLGKGLAWIGKWQEARSQMETCVRQQPDSVEDHYRLGQVYQHLGLSELAREQFALHEVARDKMGEDLARRDATVRKFIYDLQGGSKPQEEKAVGSSR